MSFLKDITLGRYVDRDSAVHAVDPRAKLAVCLVAMAGVFAPVADPGSLATVVTAWPLLGLGLLLSGLNPGYFIRGLKPFFWLFVFTLVIHGFTHPGAPVRPFPLLGLTLTVEGIGVGVATSLRLATAIAFSSLLTLTTSPVELVWALEKLLSPLKRLKVPVGEFCLSLLLAIRFFPILAEEGAHLAKALAARGIDLRRGGWLERARNIAPLLAPLFRQVINRSENLALAMQIRGYVPGRERTNWRSRSFTAADLAALILGAATFGASLTLGRG